MILVRYGDREHACDEDGPSLGLFRYAFGRVGAGHVGWEVGGSERFGEMASAAEALGAAQRTCSILYAGAQYGGIGGLGVEGHNVDLVGVAAVVHGEVAEHAVEADVGQVGRLLGPRLGFGLDLGVLVDVGHGGDGAAAGAYAREAGDRGRARRRCGLRDERGAAGMQSAKRRPCCARSARACRGRGGRVGARRGRLGVEQNGLGHGGRLILGDDDAAVARVVEVDLW